MSLNASRTMRAPFLAALLTFSAATAAASEPPNARAAYVERRGMLEADAQCRLFTRDMRAALSASAGQARGTLLRAGWSRAQVGELERTIVTAARARTCADPRTMTAADTARAGFGHWLRTNDMAFQGWARTWNARRVAASDGWRLRQEIDAPARAQFGVRDRQGAERLTFIVPLARGAAAPTSARLQLRDPARTRAPEIALQQRVSFGLESGAPSPRDALLNFSATPSAERVNNSNQAVFTFPDAAFSALLALDPRESVAITLQQQGRTQRLLVEVGDIAAARDFLSIGAN